jgi:hypothetical protein
MDDKTTKERKSEFIVFRIEPEYKKSLRDEAKKQGETLSAWCYWLLGLGVLAETDKEFLKSYGIED